MAKKNKRLSVESAVAIVLAADPICCTKRQEMKYLLTEVMRLVSNPKLTIKKLTVALKRWIREGWAIVSSEFIQITRSGRVQIKMLAEKAIGKSRKSA